MDIDVDIDIGIDPLRSDTNGLFVLLTSTACTPAIFAAVLARVLRACTKALVGGTGIDDDDDDEFDLCLE